MVTRKEDVLEEVPEHLRGDMLAEIHGLVSGAEAVRHLAESEMYRWRIIHTDSTEDLRRFMSVRQLMLMGHWGDPKVVEFVRGMEYEQD